MSKISISIPNKLYLELKQVALEQNVSVDNFIKCALEMYLEQLDIESFTKSFQRAAKSKVMLEIAEEGVNEYFEKLLEFENNDESNKKNK